MSGVSAFEMSCPIKLSLHVTASKRPPPSAKNKTKKKPTLTDFQSSLFDSFFDTEPDEAAISLLKLAS